MSAKKIRKRLYITVGGAIEAKYEKSAYISIKNAIHLNT